MSKLCFDSMFVLRYISFLYFTARFPANLSSVFEFDTFLDSRLKLKRKEICLFQLHLLSLFKTKYRCIYFKEKRREKERRVRLKQTVLEIQASLISIISKFLFEKECFALRY